MATAAAAGGTAAIESVDIGHGVALHCSMHARDGSVEVGLAHGGHHLGGAVFHHGAPRRGFKLSTRLLEADLGIEVDHFGGDVTVSGHLEVGGHPLIAFNNDVLARYSPCSGTVGAEAVPDPPVVRSRRFGASAAYASHITRIFVDDETRLFTDVGKLVYQRMFPDHPPFVFNTVACTGAHDPATGEASYTDPYSDWFNIFIGYYQIDVDKPAWGRPFGYKTPAGRRSEVQFDDLARLGKSDWNYFANWMYGVPDKDVMRCSTINLSALTVDQSKAEQVGASLWHLVSVDGLDFVSAYESDAPGAEKLVRNSLLTGVWRRCYGPPVPRPNWRQSFVPTRMTTRLLMSYWEDDDAFHTVMFGGTTPVGGDPAFLQTQLAAGRAVIERSFPQLGFPPSRFSVARALGRAPGQASPADAPD